MSALAVRACFSVVKGAIQYYKLIILDGSLACFCCFPRVRCIFTASQSLLLPNAQKVISPPLAHAAVHWPAAACAHWVLFSFFIFVCIADVVMILLGKLGFEFERSIQQRCIGRTSAFVAIIS